MEINMKKVVSIHRGPPAHWVGDGFHVHSLFSYDKQPRTLSPFLLLDYGPPEVFAPSSSGAAWVSIPIVASRP